MTLTPKQAERAINYNQRHQYCGRSPYWIADFWLKHTTSGLSYADAYNMVDVPDYSLFDDPKFMAEEVLASDGGVQDFLYSDPGDSVAGVPSQPALAREKDGMFGQGTLRRLEAYLESLKPISDTSWHEEANLKTSDHIVVAGEKHAVPNVRVVSFDEPGSFSFADVTKKGYRKWGSEKSKVNHIAMLHWDAAFSAKACFRILKARGYASCFGIDNPTKSDGIVTVYQWLDPGLYRAAHGGKWPNRRCHASVDFSNAVYPKYAARYEKATGIKRPLIKGARNNGTSTLLGLYKGQIVSWMRIEKVLGEVWGMKPWFATGDRKGKPAFYPSMQAAPEATWMNGDDVTVRTHLEYTKKKWDVAGYQEQVIVLYLTDPQFREEFPWVKENFKLEESFWADWLEDIKSSWTWPEIGWE